MKHLVEYLFLKQTTEPFKRLAELLKHLAELSNHPAEFLKP